ncbi:hypothetical protein [Teredinibacter haidensis]|uniref:hypothetical protein n=1 Tax=Teredinibacter haidensis TaxID=2731755 RepID=UPI000A5BF213|nr:hypothetical protein [Teredinibacter haidensis]
MGYARRRKLALTEDNGSFATLSPREAILTKNRRQNDIVFVAYVKVSLLRDQSA